MVEILLNLSVMQVICFFMVFDHVLQACPYIKTSQNDFKFGMIKVFDPYIQN